MSTRVHELAKKHGVKSQELIDLGQKAGLDIKPSPLASIDAETVERIELLLKEQAGAPEAFAAAPPAPRAQAPAPSPPEPPARPVAAASAPAPAAPAVTPPRPSALTAPPATATPPAPAPDRLSSSVPVGSRPTGPSQGPAPARPGAPVRSSAGPLSGHTPHRGSLGPVAPAAGPRPTGPAAPPPGGPAAPGGAVRRSDYISPTGTRMPPSLAPRPAGPPPLGGRRPPGAGESPRRDQQAGAPRPPGARPLPSVAPLAGGPTGPIRRPDAGLAPRATGPTQRPDMKFTPAQLREMMAKAGQGPGRVPPGSGPIGPIARPTGPAASRPTGPAVPLPGVPIGPRGPAADAPPGEEDDERRGKPGHGSPGSKAGRDQRRADRKRAAERRGSGAVALVDDDDSQRSQRGPRRGKGHRGQIIAPRKSEATIEPPVTVRALSEGIGIKAADLLKKLFFKVGPGVTINSVLDDEAAEELALDFGIVLSIAHERTAEDDLEAAFEDEGDDEPGELRPPVITILGHVDHGKTSLLDRIRSANVVASESGGITQHIGAYQIEHNGKKIAFVDTPGHEAFTAMRARGANVTDIVVLVVAADDGVMPQTVEAIAHARAADVPVVVALNKIDLPNVESTSNINKIYGELAQQGLNPTEWGGETEVIRTSTVTGRGLDDLLTTLDLTAELLDLKARPARPATGTCLEAAISEGRGVIATVLVQDGTLKVGDVVVCGDGYGRVRALLDDKGRHLPEAGPSTPVELSGLDSVPTAGEKFGVVEDISRAREIAETRRGRGRIAVLTERQPITLENIFSQLGQQKVKTLNLILKADVQGSLEALTKELEKLKNDEVPIRVLLKAVGGISESDVSLAEASEAIVIGFRVAPEDRAVTLAEEKKIDIRRYDIIYQVTDEIKKAVEGMLVPETKDVHLGRATVRQVFKITKVGAVAGCIVTQGIIERSAKARIIREGREIYKGTIEALKRFKDDVREVRENFECGIKITNFDDIKVDDTIEAYRTDVIRRTL